MMTDNSDFDAKRNLIVNYLPQSMSEEEVRELFSRHAAPSKVRLMMNPSTNQSLSYAFIEYPDEISAAGAIAQLDGTKIQDKTIKVSYARKSSPEIKDTNVYISGLPLWITESDLLNMFNPFGEVITHKLLLNPDNTSKGVGFVRYSLKREAESAINSMNGHIIPNSGNKPLVVKLAIPAASKQQNQAGILSQNIQLLGKTGNLRYNPLAVSNQLPLNHLTGMMAAPPPPLPGVDASSINGGLFSAAHAASPLLNNQQLDTNQSVFSIYVYGLQAQHTELTLYELFAPFGGIINVRLIRDLQKPEKPCKGFGFVNFRKYDEAYTAVLSMNNRMLEGRPLQVSFKSVGSV